MARTKKNKPGYWRRKAEAEAKESATKALDSLEAELEGQPKEQEEQDGNTDEVKAAPTEAFRSQLDRFRNGNPNATPQEIQQNANAQRKAEKASRKRPLTDNDADPPLSKRQRKKLRNGQGGGKYAPPSKYAHLPKLTDILDEGLICVFVGTNPGIRTAEAGHAYAHPSNLFWKLLHQSGCTDVRLPPEHDVFMPKWYAMGNTNIVERPSKDAAELSKTEMTAGVPVLDEKIATFRPQAVCIVGKGIYEAIFRYKHGREIKKEEFLWGWQPESERMGKSEGWDGAPVFVTSSTSGAAASLKPDEKLEIWKPFGEWVRARRKEKYGSEGRIDMTVTTADGVDGQAEKGGAAEEAEVAEGDAIEPAEGAGNEAVELAEGSEDEVEAPIEPAIDIDVAAGAKITEDAYVASAAADVERESTALKPDVADHIAATPTKPASAEERAIGTAVEKHDGGEHQVNEG